MSKITKATFKKFVRENNEKLQILVSSTFDCMIDGVAQNHGAKFSPITKTERNVENTLGIVGLWLVGSSRDYFTEVSTATHRGIRVYNCCGSAIVAIEV